MKIAQQKLAQFFILTFGTSWTLWMPGVLSSLGVISIGPNLTKVLELLGAACPAAVGLYMAGRFEGKKGLQRMLISSFAMKVFWRFWLGAVALLVALHAIARLFFSLIESNLPTSEFLQSPIDAILLFLLMFLFGGGLDEEIGWRGYALDLIQRHTSALTASALLFIAWSAWWVSRSPGKWLTQAGLAPGGMTIPNSQELFQGSPNECRASQMLLLQLQVES